MWKYIVTNYFSSWSLLSVLEYIKLVTKKVAKTWLFSIIVTSLFLIFFGMDSPLLLDSGSDSDSESESNKPSKGKATSESPKIEPVKAKFDIDSMNNANVSHSELSKFEAPRSNIGTVASMQSRMDGMMSRFIALNLESIKTEIQSRGIGGKDYSELSAEDKLLMDKYDNESAALAKFSGNHMISSLQAEKDKISFAVKPQEPSTGLKRDLAEDSSSVESTAKKIATEGSSSKKLD